MKKIIALTAFTLIAALYFGSCDLLAEKYNPRERMEAFIEDANNGRWLDLKQHTHPDATQYSQAGAASFWSNEFISSYLPLSSPSITGATATFENSNGDTTYTATLAEDEEDNYKILDIYNDTAGSYVFE